MTSPGNRRRYRVAGASMFPALREGDVIDVDVRAFDARAPLPGELVLVRHPFKNGPDGTPLEIVKRVHAIDDDGRIDVRGDDPIESSDSRSFGPLRPEAVIGLVTGVATEAERS